MSQKLIPWNTGGGNIVVNYSGSGNDTVTVGSDTDNPSFNPRSQSITVRTTAGASISRVVTITQSGKTVPIGTIYNFAYTGTVQSQKLPAGTYKLQVWGAQGGSNPADSTYGITSQAGGKGGYSEGILTLTQQTTLYIFVGGQPTNIDNHGGWNGGGGGAGSSSNGEATDTNGFGVSKIGKGGGGTDIALVTSSMNYGEGSGGAVNRTNRSSASLLSRFIVAGGGSGGAMALKRKTTTTTSWEQVGTAINLNQSSGTTGTWNGYGYKIIRSTLSSGTRTKTTQVNFNAGECPLTSGHYKAVWTGLTQNSATTRILWTGDGSTDVAANTVSTGVSSITREFDFEYTAAPSSSSFLRFQIVCETSFTAGTLEIYKQNSSTTTTDTYDSQVGYAGGGVNGKGYSSTYYGQQDTAGTGGGFGYGAGLTGTAYRYMGGRGGGGWYGGSEGQSNADNISYIKRSGGGSGFINIAANAQYRPSGYTGLQLNSGATYDGTQPFESVNGGTETGHGGNGYARITRVS